MGIKELRKLLMDMNIKTSSHYAFNDKRKTFTRRLKIAISRNLKKNELQQIKLSFPGAFEVKTFKISDYRDTRHIVTVKIK